MYEMKLGLGGHGLQPFNTETGKYENIDVSLPDGTIVSNYDDFLHSQLPPEYMSAYERGGDIKSQIDDAMEPIWGQVLSTAINAKNRDNKKGTLKFFSTAEEAIKGAPDTITKGFVDELAKMGFPNKTTTKAYAYSDVELSSMVVAYMRSRYPQTKFNPISEEEYEKRFANAYTDIFDEHHYNISADDLKKAWNSGKDIPIWRGLRNIDNSIDARNDCVAGMIDENHQTITNIGSPRFYGSCIYMSASKEYSKGSYTSFGLLVHGLVRGGAVQHPLDYHQYENVRPYRFTATNYDNQDIKKISDFVATIDQNDDFKNSVKSKFLEFGFDDQKAKRASDLFVEYIRNDIGFCAAVLGYDAIIGDDGQFDILDPSVIDLSVQWE